MTPVFEGRKGVRLVFALSPFSTKLNDPCFRVRERTLEAEFGTGGSGPMVVVVVGCRGGFGVMTDGLSLRMGSGGAAGPRSNGASLVCGEVGFEA